VVAELWDFEPNRSGKDGKRQNDNSLRCWKIVIIGYLKYNKEPKDNVSENSDKRQTQSSWIWQNFASHDSIAADS
jgi:hypothetical protein